MQIRHVKSLIAASEGLNRITAVAWSPNGQKIAVCGADRIIQIFDETGERKDRFATKPADPQKTTKYNVVAMAFSPDSTKLAVAQSDDVVFVYKLGLEWGEKKSICNKFIQTEEVTCLTWPAQQPNSVVFGVSDGKVRIGNLKTNKSATLYQTESYVISLASSLDGNAVISGHLDGTINRFFFDDGVSGASQGKFAIHKCPPYALSWADSIVAAGNDRTVIFYDTDGRIMQEFDYSRDVDEQDFTVAEFSPSKQSLVVGSFNKFRVYNLNATMGGWEEAEPKNIENFYSVTALSWRPDGSRIVAGNSTGAFEMFDCCLKRTRYRGKFEFTHVSSSQVIVKRLSTGSRIVLKSYYGYEVSKINIFQDQFLVAHTPETLLLGDLSSCKLSEIPWTGGGNEKFYFDHAGICMVFNAGELTLVEYGTNDVLGSCRTEHMSPHLISVRVNERKTDQDYKRIAYLVDLQTIHILDLLTGSNVGIINHESKVDWLELSGKANKLLFRDKRRQLHLYDIATQTRTTLLHACSYVQWVPGSDVVVAQSRNNLCIWYSIDSPERVTMFPIKGEIETIERRDGKTEVVVDEGVSSVSYTLDEGLIEFGTAVDDRDYERAIALLETLEMTPETEAMWKTLSGMALKDRRLVIAERCFAALGDVARVRYLQQVRALSDTVKEQGLSEEMAQCAVEARLAVLDKNFKLAERLLLEQGRTEDAMEMYQELHKWNLSIRVAEIRGHPELETLKRNYFQWLVDSGQEPQAAELKETEGDIVGAISLYLKGGMPARAAYLLNMHNLVNQTDLAERIASALHKSGLYEKAGNLYERLRSNDRALDSYKKGKAYRAAIDLCRTVYPSEVVALEEQWADYLVSQKQYDAAVNHYIEAGKSFRAIEAAITARQWKKAVNIIDSIHPPDAGKPYFGTLAAHFESVEDYQLAERFYVAAGKTQEAVDMYTRSGQWEKAHTLATTYMSAEQVAVLYVTQARELEQKGKLRDAEKLYLTVGEPDLAINMYKNHKQYDHMIRLVTAYHKELLGETHLYLAKTLETEGNYRQAEHHYIEGKDWKSAVNMYCANNMYEEGHRVAKANGGATAAKHVAYLWARSLGGESAVKLLTKFGLLDSAIEFAAENGAFEFAFEMARFSDNKEKIADVHYRQGLFLEDEGKYKEAEQAFILGGKPKEAVMMYLHNDDFESALRIAEAYDPPSIADVLCAQGKKAFDNGDFNKMESLVLRAQHPELALRWYKELGMWKEALQFAKEYAPARVSEINEDYEKFINGKTDSGKDEILATAKSLEAQKDYMRAIDMYLRLSTTHTNDVRYLEKAWEKAVDLALKFVPERTADVVSAACVRLIEVKRFSVAAELFIGSEMYKNAIDAYIQGGIWEKARELLNVAPKYREYVESQYVNHLKNSGAADALASVDAAAGLDMLATRGEWDKCLAVAAKDGNVALLQKYLGGYSVALIKESRFSEAVEAFNQYGVFANPQFFDLYTRLSKEILLRSNPEHLAALREMLYKLVTSPASASQQQVQKLFRQFLMMAHLMTLRSHIQRKNSANPALQSIAAKISIALLRYTQTLPADRTFYEAGLYAKNANMLNMAFVCWNRFIDLAEAIEEGTLGGIENADFEGTDVPFEVAISESAVPEQKREEARDWVLQVSLDQKVQQEVDKRACEECNTETYAASLICHNCHSVADPCIVTGYPLTRSKVKCNACGQFANKEDWNKFVMVEKMCPWCGSACTPNYSLK